MIYPDCDMKRWSHCDNSVVLANADYYYTKEQVDKKFDDFDGVTDEEVQRMINTSIRTKADKADVNALSGQVQANTDAIENTYTKQETNAAVTAATTPINNTLTAHTADTSIHVTSAEKTYWNNKLDASAYTPTDLSNYYTKGQTDGLLNEKLDASAYTPTDLSNYYTKQETNGVVDGAVSGKADTSAVTAVANDVQTVSGQVATKVATSDFNTYTAATATALNGKADTSAVTTVASDVETLSATVETKQDALVYYSEDTENKLANIDILTDDGEGNTEQYLLNVGGGANTFGAFVETDDGEGNITSNDAQINIDPIGGVLISASNSEDGQTTDTYLTVESTGVTINGDAVATEPYVDAATSGKADTSAVTAVNDALTAHTANTSVHVTAAEKAEWDSKAEVIELTQAQYDVLVTKDPDVLYVISDAAPAEVIISTTITSSSTNGEAASAKAVYDFVGGLKMVKMTSAEYQALTTKDSNTVYFVGDATNGYTMKLGEANIN